MGNQKAQEHDRTTTTTQATAADCQTAWDRVCNNRFTCGARITHEYGITSNLAATVRKVAYWHCPHECKEFRNNQCDSLINRKLNLNADGEQDDYESVVTDTAVQVVENEEEATTESVDSQE